MDPKAAQVPLPLSHHSRVSPEDEEPLPWLLLYLSIFMFVCLCVCEAVAPPAAPASKSFGEKCFWVVFVVWIGGERAGWRADGGGACLLLFVLHFDM